MTLLDTPRHRPLTADDGRDEVTDDDRRLEAPDGQERPDAPEGPAERPAGSGEVIEVGGTRIDTRGRITYRGMRIRRVRLKSVAKLAFVFWLLAGLILVGTVVVVWNVAQSLGFVGSFEETITTSLGLETFQIEGAGIFRVVAGGIAALCTFGWITTVAMAAVYNAACGVLGGLAVETGPLQRRRRVFSWRHRRFITIAE